MEIGKLTAKLRDAVPVCFLVDGKEIKRYKNIDIPDELKKLEYQDFKFDVPLHGNITFKISFAPGVLPEEFPQARERRIRIPKDASVAIVSKAPAETSIDEEVHDATQDTMTNIAFQESLAAVIVAKTSPEVAGKEEGLSVEAHADEEANPEVKEEPEVKEAVTSKKTVGKPKKAPVAIKIIKD